MKLFRTGISPVFVAKLSNKLSGFLVLTTLPLFLILIKCRNDTNRIACSNAVAWYIPIHETICPNNNIVTDSHALKDSQLHTDKNIIANRNLTRGSKNLTIDSLEN